MSNLQKTDKTDIINGKLDERKGRLLLETDVDITSTHVPVLRRGMMDFIESTESSAWKFLYLDLRTARIIDSTGVNWLFAESVRLREEGKQLVLRISSPAINRVFEFAGLDKVVTLKFRRRKQSR